MLEFSDIASAVGVDPYGIGEHKAGITITDEDEAFREMRQFILTHSADALDYEKYRHLVSYEHHTLIPERLLLVKRPQKRFRRLPACGQQAGDVGLLEVGNFVALGIAQHGDRRCIGRRVVVDE